MSDIRYAFRVLWRAPGPTMLAVLVLAVGIGANATLLAVADVLLMGRLPYAASGRPVQVITATPQSDEDPFAPANYLDLRGRQRAFSRTAAYRSNVFDLVEPDRDPGRVTGAEVTGEFFDVFDVAPQAGRLLTPDDAGPGVERRVVLSAALWSDRYGRADVIGRRLRVNDQPVTIVGIAPASFDWPAGAALWLAAAGAIPSSPMALPDLEASRDLHYLGVVGRLAEGVSIEAARADVAAISSSLARQFPVTNGARRFDAVTLEDQVFGHARAPLLLVMAAGLLVLLIAWSNVAGLQLARGLARTGELAVRQALGATDARLARQLLVESLVLGGLGGLGGVALAAGLVHGVVTLGASLPRIADVELSAGVLVATVMLTIACSVVFGTVQAWQAGRGLATAVRAGRTDAPPRSRLRGALVLGEVALAMVLIIGAGLLARTAWALVQQHPGFDPSGVITVGLALPEERYTPAQQADFHRQVLDRIAAQPVLGDAAITYPLPGAGQGASGGYMVEGETDPDDPDKPIAWYASVSPDFFRTTRIPLLRGRTFTEADRIGAEPVVIISEALARQHWPDEDPLSGRLDLGGGTWFQVVGVAGDVRQNGPGTPPQRIVYIPYGQFTVQFSSLLVRPRSRDVDVATAVRGIVRELDPALPLGAISSLDSVLWNQTEASRMRSLVFGLFAGVALLLASAGLYGLMSFAVFGRTREFGVRLALGARPGDLLSLVTRQGLVLVSSGVVLGAGASWMLSRVLEQFLFGVPPTDLWTYGTASGLLILTGTVASWVPARRAANTDPLTAMRSDR